MKWKNLMPADVVVVPGCFIDEYMKGANGEFVKVYLYLLRHQADVSEEEIADALDMTGADVRRALAYWTKAGVLEKTEPAADPTVVIKPAPVPEKKPANKQEKRTVDMALLERDEDFKQLIYIAQQYLNKLFTQTDTEILGNLYQNLGMSAELLEYLMEYCAENRHTSLRYAETVALNWKEQGVTTAAQAREASQNYNRRIFCVMKAMGLSDRGPGAAEKESIERWFDTYGFDEKIVTEACNRTLERIHKPSFPYAEKILKDWKDAGVKTFSDIEAQDRVRSASDKSRSGADGRGKIGKRPGQKSTRFDNFESHGYDYDEMVWNMISRNAGGNDGTE